MDFTSFLSFCDYALQIDHVKSVLCRSHSDYRFENHVNVWRQYDQYITYTYQYIIEIREILLLHRLPTKANELCPLEIDSTP